jgi:oligopeptide/dipeptide ABC transporter ATP-binding protein
MVYVLQPPVLVVNKLSIGFSVDLPPLVENVSFTLQQGEIVGLVGESGCGKSLTSLAILGLLPKGGRILSGNIQFEGNELTTLDAEAYRQLRGNRMAFIPQDPLSALNPVYTIGNQIAEVLQTHTSLSPPEIEQKVISLLDAVKIPNAKERFAQYPHEFSGGMRQRVMIAMALACNPSLLIADEPTTALDVTVQAQILALLGEIRQEFNMSVLLITHDLGVLAQLCDRMMVLYAGRLAETGKVEAVFKAPSHPYTTGLLAAVPRRGQAVLSSIAGQPPTLSTMPTGCRFSPRCTYAFSECDVIPPTLRPLNPAERDDSNAPLLFSHHVACYLHHPIITQ